MISKYNSCFYCKEDISHIENYDIAIKDTKQWDCHHKAELLPCGRFSIAQLKKYGLYFNRPANELIFIRHDYHIGMHMKGIKRSIETIENIRKSKTGDNNPRGMLGKRHSYATREKMALVQKSYRWWNNGIINRFCKECPSGFTPGRIKKKNKNAKI